MTQDISREVSRGGAATSRGLETENSTFYIVRVKAAPIYKIPTMSANKVDWVVLIPDHEGAREKRLQVRS